MVIEPIIVRNDRADVRISHDGPEQEYSLFIAFDGDQRKPINTGRLGGNRPKAFGTVVHPGSHQRFEVILVSGGKEQKIVVTVPSKVKRDKSK